MIRYPLHFSVAAKSTPGTNQTWETLVSKQNSLRAAIPPEFDGPGGGFSPEDFYALAILNCFNATFKVIAEKSKFDFKELVLSGVLTVDRDAHGIPWMSHFALKAILSGCSDLERARHLLEKTSQSCLVLNSIRTQKTFTFDVL